MPGASVRELVADLEAELNNGGFHQFFFNSAGDRAAQTREALRAIGAVRTAALLERACARFPGGAPPVDGDERQVLMLTLAPRSDEFDAEDTAFYAGGEDLRALVEAYCRAEAGG
jgi:hypothetical protein